MEGAEMKTAGALFAILIGVLVSSPGLAHHAFTAFDRNQVIDLEGEVVHMLWANPHVRFTLRVANGDGSSTDWNVEGQSLSILSRIGMDQALFAPGSTIRAAGWPGRNDRPILGLTNALISGKEYVTFTRAEPFWTDDVDSNPLFVGGTASQDRSIFRVWSTDFDDPESNAGGFWASEYPLTEFALGSLSDYSGGGGGECEPKGMPTIMEQPYPVEFTREGDRVVLRMEEYDSVRTIHMNGEAASRAAPGSIFGHSRGEWDGETLVVMTAGVEGWPHFDKRGVPQSDAMTFVERFTPTEDGSRLDYSIVVTDPEVFTEPVTLDKHWVYRPGETVQPFDCTPGE